VSDTFSKNINCAQIHVTCCSGLAFGECSLETVHLELVRLGQAAPRQPLADVLTLVPLQLQHLSVLRVLNHSAIASKFLQKTKTMQLNKLSLLCYCKM